MNYRIDVDDRIVSWSEEYSGFAEANDGAELADVAMHGRSLWDFIKDDRTSMVYRSLVDRAREGHSSSFCFRCDGPDTRRHLSMTITGIEDGGVSFDVDEVSVEGRERQSILDRREPRSNEFVLFCSWCSRLRIAIDWHELETAVPLLGIIDEVNLPKLEYVMCDTCYSERSRR